MANTILLTKSEYTVTLEDGTSVTGKIEISNFALLFFVDSTRNTTLRYTVTVIEDTSIDDGNGNILPKEERHIVRKDIPRSFNDFSEMDAIESLLSGIDNSTGSKHNITLIVNGLLHVIEQEHRYGILTNDLEIHEI